MKKLLFSVIAILGFTVVSFGQNFATAVATGTIITPIAITHVTDMNFGTIAVLNGVAGVVTLPATTGTPTRTVTGGATLPPSSTGSPTAAAFNITGATGYSFSITLPTGTYTLTGSVSGTMTADTWTSSLGATSTMAAGDNPLYVGANLNVGATQAAGLYTGPAFTVTVNYN